MTVLSYPIPLYQNLPINADYYQPSRFVITAITTGQQTLVTTETAHNYVIGQEVRLIIPPSFGCRSLNEQTCLVIDIPTTTSVLLNLFSLYADPFYSSSATTQAQILAVGNINSGSTTSTGNTLNPDFPGSFSNISP